MLHKIAVIGVLGLCLGSFAPGLAGATPAQKVGAQPSLNLNHLKKALEGGDEAQALAALDEIDSAGDGSAAALVDGLLTRGASSKLLLRAITVAGALGKEASSAALAPYVRHRTPAVRRAAAQSLLRTKGKPAVQALREALRSNDAELRSTAAEGLGTLGAKDAVPDLFAVLPKEVPEAAGAIGTLCNADDCQRFLSFLGRLPFDEMQSGFLPILLRTDSDVPDSLKLSLIGTLQRMATPKSGEVLATALATYPPGGSPKVRAALDAASHGHTITNDEP
jgi:HEAT repeat protein